MSDPIYISHYNQQTIDINEFPVGNPVVVHTIQLLNILSKLKRNGTGQPVLTQSDLECIHKNVFKSNQDFKNLPKLLNRDSILELLKRSVILITTHCGFHETSESVITVLTQLTQDFLVKICNNLRFSADTQAFKGENDFIDLINRVFNEMGFDLTLIQNFEATLHSYRENVLKEVMSYVHKL